MLENRRHMRIREITDIRWSVVGHDETGEGTVSNISVSGLLLQTDAKFNPQHQGVIFIDAPGEEPLGFGAKKGKIVWMRRMPEGRPGFQCGVEFMNTAAWDKSLNEWIERKSTELSQAANANILNHYIF